MLSLKNDFLLSLTDNCPLVTYRKECPFVNLHQSSSQQKAIWLKKLTSEECSKLIDEHNNCLADRLGKDGT